MVKTYEKDDYDSLSAGLTNRWKFVHRIDNENAVCLISRVLGQKINCRQMIRTKSSNSKGIFDHGKNVHSVDIDVIHSNKKKFEAENMKKFLIEKKFNEIWTFESAICRLVCENNLTLHGLKNSFVIKKLLNNEFQKKLPNLSGIKKIIINHANELKGIIKAKISDFLKRGITPNFMFDEWTSRGTIQYISLVVGFKDASFNLGLIEIESELADAKAIEQAIAKRLEEFGLTWDSVQVFTADGAKTNGKVAQNISKAIQKCHNHGVHLAVIETFYKDSAVLNKPIDENESDSEVDLSDVEPDCETVEAIDEESDKECDELDSSEEEIRTKYADLILRVRKVSTYFKNSAKAMRVLKRHTKLKPVLDVKTRWSSLHYMLTRFCDIQKELQTASIVLRKDFPFTVSEIKAIEKINNVLKVAKNIVNTLSKFNSNLNTADLIFSHAINELSDDDEIEKTFKQNLMTRYLERRIKHADYLAYLLQHQVPQGSNIFFDQNAIQSAESEFLRFTKPVFQIEIEPEEPTVLHISAVEQSLNINLNELPKKSQKKALFHKRWRILKLNSSTQLR